MDKKVAVISALFEKKNKRKPKNSKELLDFIKQQGGEEFLKKVDEYISQAEAEQSKQALKAEHGAKLQYFKKLKNQCAEDEEVVYYKKGGLVDCGCKKKEGGEVVKAEPGTKFNKKSKITVKEGKSNKNEVSQTHTNLSNPKFKNDYSSKRVKDSNEAAISGYYQEGGKPQPKPQSNKPKQNTEKREEPFEPNKRAKPSGNTSRNTSGKAKIMIQYKKGSEIVNKFKAKCGSKIKKHLLGGSLNGIPFYLGGTPKGGIPTAPKATDRYKGGFILDPNHWYFQTSMKYKDGTSTGVAENVNYWERTPSIITLQILDNDTIYRETPGQKRFALRGFPVTRLASYSGNNKQEYLTLKRRFNEAKSVAEKP